MGDFKLKQGIKVTYVPDKKAYRFTPVDKNKMKKVTSRAYSCLIGDNKWESIGKTILERFKMIQPSEIDKYYSVRGDMAELLTLTFLTNHYKSKGIDVELMTWDKNKVQYDNFRHNEKFGGLLDIGIKSPENLRAVVEVKSKSLKDIDKIKKSRGNIEEVQQGLFLTYLSNMTRAGEYQNTIKKCLMVYVFFTPDQESAIENYTSQKELNEPGFDTRKFAKELINEMGLIPGKSCKISIFKHELLSPPSFKQSMDSSYQRLLEFGESRMISEEEFSFVERDYLDELSGNVNNGLF